MSSLVNQVLQDDQVFAFLGGEGRGPKRQSPLLGPAVQETMDCSVKIDEYNALYGRALVFGMFISQENHKGRRCFILRISVTLFCNNDSNNGNEPKPG